MTEPRPCCDCACGQTVARIATTCFDVAECEFTPNMRMVSHAHERASFCLVLEGGYTEESSASTTHYDEAMLIFRPAGAIRTNVVSARGSLCLTVEIAPDVISSLGSEITMPDRLRVGGHSVAHWFAYKLRRELRATDALTPMVIDGVGIALLAEFARTRTVRFDRIAPIWLERARAQLHEEFASPPSLASLAATAGVHRAHLARAFRKHYGCTMGDYVRQRRIANACHRLSGTDTPLSDIALDAGFADQSHFTTTFKRLVGITPGEFRSRAMIRE